jgi:tetratricopeptide (TPR) repeat protein
MDNVDFISKAEYVNNKAIELNNSNWESILNLGELKRSVGLFEEALNWFKKAMQLYPTNAHTHFNIGLTYYDLDDYYQAEPYFKRAIEILPNFSEAYQYLARLYMEQEQNDRAIATFKSGIKKGLPFTWLHHGLAVAYKNCGRFDESLAEFEIASEISPKQRFHYLAMATVYVEQGDYDKALLAYQMTQSKFPNCLYTALNYSLVLNMMGKENLARRTLEIFLEKSKIEYENIDASYSKIALFYLGKINETEMLNGISSAYLKMKIVLSFADSDYYIGMSHLLNLKNNFENQPRDTVKAIEYLHKYVSSEGIKCYMEYSLAKAELKKLTKLD